MLSSLPTAVLLFLLTSATAAPVNVTWFGYPS